MVYALKRYLGNSNTMEVHDTQNQKVGCKLDQINAQHQRWFDTHAEAQRAGFDNCAWCLGNSKR